MFSSAPYTLIVSKLERQHYQNTLYHQLSFCVCVHETGARIHRNDEITLLLYPTLLHVYSKLWMFFPFVYLNLIIRLTWLLKCVAHVIIVHRFLKCSYFPFVFCICVRLKCFSLSLWCGKGLFFRLICSVTLMEKCLFFCSLLFLAPPSLERYFCHSFPCPSGWFIIFSRI